MNKPNREENKQAAKILEWEKLKFQNYISPNEIKTIAGMDCLYYIKDGIKMGVCAYQIFNYDTGEILVQNHIIAEIKEEYTRGFLYYHERELMELAVN